MNNLVSTTWRRHAVCNQRFSIPVLAPPPLCTFRMLLLLLQMFVLSAYVSALQSEHHRIVRHDSSSKRTYSIQSAYKCARREFKLYIYQRYMMSNSSVLEDAAQRKPWMNVPKWSKLQWIPACSGSSEQWTLCIESVSIGTQFMHGAHF